ncbi:hypothetical protein CBM2615_A10045 [Cupriavidus taiwanensis]|uniref:Uncharacterized protein n=1 Tax=Cupriavidus taiwanensis TaxID=164546 RepID=A0A375DVE9_9BURK|nr:hypothetical protein CBM2614_A10046 [Cupriavidus taiwanensis]SOZ48782.1 hypothetical protein CBM2615_A10045 [Cupriavidus taiwanensis]SOZ51606.1 hypothetical protein CBM2613_A10045 [Cupriavidus taiwanensis]SPA03986.1 hypothetical protein CBM2625_A10045 [Cupriavidus taiwanensis]
MKLIDAVMVRQLRDAAKSAYSLESCVLPLWSVFHVCNV